MTQRLSKHPHDVRRLIRALDALRAELDLLILKEPTGYPREELTSANLYLMAAESSLKGVS